MPFFGKSSGDDEARAHQLSEQLTLLARQDPQFALMLQQSAGSLDARNRVMGSAGSPEIRAYLAQRGIEFPEGFSIRPHSAGGQSVVQVGAPEHMPGIAPTLAIGAPLGAAAINGLMGGAPAASGGGLPPHLGGTLSEVTASGMPGWLETILKVAPVGAGLVGKLAGGGFGGGNTGPVASPELDELLKLSMQRMRDQEPLFQSVTKQALAGLPTYAQGGK